MSKASHTPGPWTFGPAAVVLGANGKRICQLAVRIDMEECGDAALVVTAPELLDALQNMVNVSRSVSGFSPMMREHAERVIAKAEGCHDV